MTFWVHAENLLLDSSSVSSAELYGSDVHFTVPPESVIAAPRKSILFCAADLQEVIFEEDESQVEELYADGYFFQFQISREKKKKNLNF